MSADDVNTTTIKGRLFEPVLGPLMLNRWIMVLATALTVVQISLSSTGALAWQCPLKSILGVICPGCGLTRAIHLLARGHWKAAMQLHAFAPLFLGGGIFLLIGSILPDGLRQKTAHHLAAFERRSGIVPLLVLSILAYWALRIVTLI